MNRILITFGGRAYDAQVQKQREYMELHRLATNGDPWIAHRVYDDAWLMRQPFYSENRWIFERQPQHGFGFCSWKPHIIRHALDHFAKDGDVVMYLDGDTYPIADISCLFEMAEREGIVLFEEQGCVNKTWIKQECFQAMHCDMPYFKNAMIACGRFQLFRKGDYRVEQFLAEWQAYSLNPECQFHGGSRPGVVDDPSFLRNSCEQSVLSLLAAKYQPPLHRNPDQSGWPVAHDGTYKAEDTYPQLFIQDGRRGNVADRSGSRFANIA
jgi:hypothetical protein